MLRGIGLTVLASLATLGWGQGVPDSGEGVYRGAGRRDPFVPLVGSRILEPRSCTGPGAASLRVDELALRGIVTVRGVRVALLADPRARSHFLRAGERVCDGVIVSVTPEAVVFDRERDDPLAPERVERVTKRLHP
jgi:hypothetical protein